MPHDPAFKQHFPDQVDHPEPISVLVERNHFHALIAVDISDLK